MKIVHIESGFGNQMLSFAEYLVLKKLNPDDEIFIETLIYDIKECNDVICQWNGYELDRVFGINAPNIKDYLGDEKWQIVKDYVVASKFWENNWDYPAVYVEAFKLVGIELKNWRGSTYWTPASSAKASLTNNRLGYFIKRVLRPFYQKRYIEKMSTHDKIFLRSDESVFTGQFLGLSNMDGEIDFVRDEILQNFKFPPITDERNLSVLSEIESTESVAIHARRGDMLSSNGYCYKYGYFKRAVKYIRRHVKNPVFVFFGEPGSSEWCKENLDMFGVRASDRTVFVDFNVGNDSYKDMYLMSKCKHNIVTNSSFGWWGAYLNQNPDKITCSSSVYINTNKHF